MENSLSTTMTQRRFSDAVKTGKCSSYSSMTAVHNFRPDLAVVNIAGSTRAYLIIEAVHEAEHFPASLAMKSDFKAV